MSLNKKKYSNLLIALGTAAGVSFNAGCVKKSSAASVKAGPVDTRNFTVSFYDESAGDSVKDYYTIDVQSSSSGDRLITATIETQDLTTRELSYEDFVLNEKDGRIVRVWHHTLKSLANSSSSQAGGQQANAQGDNEGVADVDPTQLTTDPGTVADTLIIDGDKRVVSFADPTGDGMLTGVNAVLARLRTALNTFTFPKLNALNDELTVLLTDLPQMTMSSDKAPAAGDWQTPSVTDDTASILSRLPADETFTSAFGINRRTQYKIGVHLTMGDKPELVITKRSAADNTPEALTDTYKITFGGEIGIVNTYGHGDAVMSTTTTLKKSAGDAQTADSASDTGAFWRRNALVSDLSRLLSKSPNKSYQPLLAYFRSLLTTTEPAVTIVEFNEKAADSANDHIPHDSANHARPSEGASTSGGDDSSRADSADQAKR